MARNSSQSMARVLERLELERPLLVTSAELARMLQEEGIATPAAVFAARMREKGWFLATGQRGVWEFAPASVAGSYSSMDPLLPARAFKAAHPETGIALTLHAAAWVFGFADRAPSVIDLALNTPAGKLAIPTGVRVHAFAPTLPVVEERNMPTLAPESVFVYMAARPADVHSWQSAAEWLPDLAFELDSSKVCEELEGRPASVWARTGYLVQGMRPDVAKAIMGAVRPSAKVRFGPRTKSIRNDEVWKVADTILPFDPRWMEPVL